MGLDAKKYTRIFSTTGSDSDKIDSDKLAHMEAKFNNNDYLEDEDNFETLAPVLFQLQKITEEFDSVRDHVVNDIVGQQGPKGDKGDKGDTGATGAAGANGRDGADGTTPTITDLDASRLPTRKPSTKGKLWNDRGIVKVS